MRGHGVELPDPTRGEKRETGRVAVQTDPAIFAGPPQASEGTLDPACERRISELYEAAREEEITSCQQSLEDFRKFMKNCTGQPKADLILTDDGHLCAIWETRHEGQTEIEFLGNGEGKIFIFKSRILEPKARCSCESGIPVQSRPGSIASHSTPGLTGPPATGPLNPPSPTSQPNVPAGLPPT